MLAGAAHADKTYRHSSDVSTYFEVLAEYEAKIRENRQLCESIGCAAQDLDPGQTWLSPLSEGAVVDGNRTGSTDALERQVNEACGDARAA